ncbi:MAG: hypothetical protein ACI4V1_08025 [Eubacteriales bacterium]
MKAFCEIVEALPAIHVPHEGLMYAFSDLKAALNSEEWVSAENLSLTPFYVFDGKLIAFDYVTLNIRLVNVCDFEDHLRRITGKRQISEIPEDVLTLQAHCYLEVPRDAPFLSAARVIQYINYIRSMPDVRDSAMRAFSSYEEANLRFTLFRETEISPSAGDHITGGNKSMKSSNIVSVLQEEFPGSCVP